MIRKLVLALLAAPTLALAAEDAVTIELTGNDQMQYSKKEITVTTGQEVTIEFKHVGALPKEAMGHNVVIIAAGTPLPAFATAAMQAPANGYIPTDEEMKDKVIAHSKMLGGGESDSFTFTAPEPGTYPYLCTFPGHFAIMNGSLIVKPKE